jgi:hypothetical protein
MRKLHAFKFLIHLPCKLEEPNITRIGNRRLNAANVNSANESLPKIYCCEIKLYDPLKVCDNCIVIISISCWTVSLVLNIFKIYDVSEADPFSETSCILNTPKNTDRVKHKCKDKVVPVLIKHYAMKTYGGVDV